LILPTRLKNLLTNLDSELNQNLLLYGNAGCGKTSAAKILAERYDSLYINVSDENSIDTVRDKIISFCKNRSIDSKSEMKVIILDEADYGTANFWSALRATIEGYSKYTRFIATCNYVNKIPPEIKSRLTPINFDPLDDSERNELKLQWNTILKQILPKFDISYSDTTLSQLVDDNFPDFRKTLNKIQELKNANITDLVSLIRDNKLDQNLFELYDLIIKGGDTVKNYQLLVSKYSKMTDECLEKLGNQFIDYLNKFYPDKGYLINKLLIVIAEYQYKRNFTMDKVVNLIACVFSLQSVFKEK